MKCNQPIGIFDSGIGGLTVLREIRRLLPQENLLYFGDTARVPYGNKSRETILRYVKENVDFLLSHEIKCLVIACNSASAYSVELLREHLPIPVIDVIEPAIEQALTLSVNKQIAVLGTKATIQSHIYQEKLTAASPQTKVLGISCPLFVPLIEENFLNHPATQLIIQEYLTPLKAFGADTLILGCTHYPLLKEQLVNFFGPEVTILDSASLCALKLREFYHGDALEKGSTQFFVTDDPGKFQEMAQQFLGEEVVHSVKLASETIEALRS